MFILGVRLWTGKDMTYPSRFSTLINFDTRESSIRTYTDDYKIDSKIYMMLTPGIAVNGEIYEYDIIGSCEDENLVGVVRFDNELGAFVVKFKDKTVYITNNMEKVEILGNIFEDWEDFKEDIIDKELFEPLLNPPDDMFQVTEIKKKKEVQKEEIKEESQEEVPQTVVEKEIDKQEIETDEKTAESKPAVKIEDLDLPEVDVPEALTENDVIDYDMFDENISAPQEPEPPQLELEEPDFELQDEAQMDINLYVDGQGDKTPAKGSFSYIMQCGDFERVDSGSEESTTKQRMELTAVISALTAINTRCNIKIYTTSQYLIVPFLKGWITRWRANNWRKESNDEIKNKDLWEQLYELYSNQNIEWEFVKPGASIVEVLRCVDLSKEALKK